MLEEGVREEEMRGIAAAATLTNNRQWWVKQYRSHLLECWRSEVLKSGYHQGPFLLEALERNPCPQLCQLVEASRNHLHFLAHGPFFQL